MTEQRIRFENPATGAGFTQLPNPILFAPGLSHAAKMLYAVLSFHAWKHGYGWATQQKLAEEMGVTDRAIRKYLAELKDARLVQVTRQGLNKPNLISVCDPPDRLIRSYQERFARSAKEESVEVEEHKSRSEERDDSSVPSEQRQVGKDEAPLSQLLIALLAHHYEDEGRAVPAVTQVAAKIERWRFRERHRLDPEQLDLLVRWAARDEHWAPRLACSDPMAKLYHAFEQIERDALDCGATLA